MIKIGLTGGIGSGKTTITSLLNTMHIPVYIADEESKRLTDQSSVIRNKLTRLFGENIYTDCGLNRKLLASYIFNDPVLLKKVNKIIHPEVQKDFLNWAKKQNSKIVVIESAILFESGFDKIVDLRLMVYAPLNVRIKRVRQRSNLTHKEIKERIANQLPEKIKKAQSDYVIKNNNQSPLIPQVEKILISILGK